MFCPINDAETTAVLTEVVTVVVVVIAEIAVVTTTGKVTLIISVTDVIDKPTAELVAVGTEVVTIGVVISLFITVDVVVLAVVPLAKTAVLPTVLPNGNVLFSPDVGCIVDVPAIKLVGLVLKIGIVLTATCPDTLTCFAVVATGIELVDFDPPSFDPIDVIAVSDELFTSVPTVLANCSTTDVVGVPRPTVVEITGE